MIGMIKIYMKKLWHGKFSIIIHYVIISIVCINLITDKVYAFDFDEKNFEFQSADYSDFFIINNEYNNGTSILLTAMTDSVAIAIGVMLVSSLFRVLKVRRFMLQYRRSKRQMELKVKGRK